MIACVCHRVAERDIALAAQAGCNSFDALQDRLGVATACGARHDCARATFERHCAAASSPFVPRAVTMAGLRREEMAVA